MSKNLARKIAALGSALLLATGLAACSKTSDTKAESTASADSAQVTEITVGASPSPHAKILKYLQESGAAEKAGLKINVKEFQDYIMPNKALEAGDIDANYFQTVPYLEDQTKENGYKFTAGKGIHLEPLGVYSQKLTDLKDLADGATVGIINDPTNQGRALKLLADQGLVKVDGDDASVVTVKNTEGANPKNLQFRELEGPALAKSLPDVDIAVINGNFALEAGLTPSKALALESTENNPAANVLVWRTDDDNPAIAKLEDLLHSDATKKYIEDTWKDKSVLPVF